MKTTRTFPFVAAFAVALSLGFSPALRAQSQDGPPPMDQGDQGPPPQFDQGAPPPPDQGQAPDQADQGNSDEQGGGDASFQTFYDQLGSQGSWIQTDNYGYVWQPNVQDPDWRPYSNGHWVYTDDGWAWVADQSEPWGWATYHYGRWVNLDGEGWVWIPGYTWAPAWVSWRYGGGYCGWAPLPPETSIGIDFGGRGDFHIGGDCDTAYDIGPGYYNFVQIGFIGSRDYRPYYVNRNNNYRIINETRNVTNINVGGRSNARFGRVSTGGPNFATINAQSRTPVQRANFASSNRMGNATLTGNQLSVYRPQLRGAGGRNARPANVSSTLSAGRANRGTDINRPLVVNSRIRPQAATSDQVQEARNAQAHTPGAGRIATDNTRLAPSLSRPLTSMTPHVQTESRTGVTPAANAAVAPRVNENVATPNRADNAFTGGKPQQRKHHDAVANQNGATGEVQRDRHLDQPARNDVTPPDRTQNEVAPRTHTEVQHQATAPVAPHDVAPMERHDVAPTEHHFQAPMEHHDAAPSQHHDNPPPHQQGGGGQQHPNAAKAPPGKGDDKKK